MKPRPPWRSSIETEIRVFVTTPRQVHGAIPALVTYAIWAIGSAWSAALDIAPAVPPTTRPYFLVGCTAFAYLFVALYSRIIARRRLRTFWPIEYAGIVFFAMLPTLITLALFMGLSISDFISLCLRLTVLVSVAESIVGFVLFRLRSRTRELEEHQSSLVDYEEKFLETVISHLHDTVQTRLFGIGIQLNQVRRSLEVQDSETLAGIISEIESIRNSDVRSFSKVVTPQISTFGLARSLEKLFEDHSKEITGSVSVELSPPLSAEEEAFYGLGVYRIAEQALINSLIHGQANKIEVRLYRRRRMLQIQIANDGKPLKGASLVQGHGFAVIDGWASKLNGTWSISNQDKRVTLDFSFR